MATFVAKRTGRGRASRSPPRPPNYLKRECENQQEVKKIMTTREKLSLFVENGVSIVHIANLAGLNKATVSRWLKGTRETVREDTEDRIENALAEIATTLYNTISGIKYDDDIILDDDD